MSEILDLRKIQKKAPALHPAVKVVRGVQPKPPDVATSTQKGALPKEGVSSRVLTGITWKAPEYVQYYKSKDWYWAVGILTTGLVATAVIMGNFLFGALVVIAGFSVALLGAKPARTLTYSISMEGVRAGDNIFPFETLNSFWIFYDPPHVKELSINTQQFISPIVKIPLGDNNPAEIRELLKQFIAEEPQEESLLDVMARYFRF